MTNDINTEVAAQNEQQSLARAEADYASISQQIQQLDVADEQARIRIAALDEEKRSLRESIRLRAEVRRRYNRRRRVYFDATHRLKLIDEGL